MGMKIPIGLNGISILSSIESMRNEEIRFSWLVGTKDIAWMGTAYCILRVDIGWYEYYWFIYIGLVSTQSFDEHSLSLNTNFNIIIIIIIIQIIRSDKNTMELETSRIFGFLMFDFIMTFEMFWWTTNMKCMLTVKSKFEQISTYG